MCGEERVVLCCVVLYVSSSIHHVTMNEFMDELNPSMISIGVLISAEFIYLFYFTSLHNEQKPENDVRLK